MSRPNCLTIAGSDPSGGAGIQADLKTFTVLGVYGMAVLTALTAQNTTEVRSVYPIPPDFVREQLQAVLDDIDCHCAKTGMLANAEIINVVADVLNEHAEIKLVLDPVMVSTTGGRLLSEDSINALITRLIPRATIVTPNAPEAEALVGFPIRTRDKMTEAAARICQMGAKNVLVKGGDMDDNSGIVTDVFSNGTDVTVMESKRVATRHTHGSGCTMAAALCAALAGGLDVLSATMAARAFVYQAIIHAESVGKGSGPVNQLWRVAQIGTLQQ